MSRQAPQEDVERALQAARGGDCVVIAAETSSVNLRWAGNTLTTNGVERSRRLTVIAVAAGPQGPAVGAVSRVGVQPGQIQDLVAEAEQAADGGSPVSDAQPLVGPGSPVPSGGTAASAGSQVTGGRPG